MQSAKTKPPHHLLEWLSCKTFMMAQLKAKTGDAHLKVIQQIWEPMNDWDRSRMLEHNEPVLHRDVVVSSWQQPCWFARTILPRPTYTAHLSLFERLEHEPLGNLIFYSPLIQRVSLAYYAIEKDSVEYSWLPNTINTQQQRLWLRYASFEVNNSDLLVDGNESVATCQRLFFYLVEILLPHLENCS